MQANLSLPPLSLYVHIPWCVRKCPYCDFNSHVAGDGLPEDAYVKALLRDLEFDREFALGRKLTSVFFGGGTPSLFSAGAIGRILQSAEQLFGFEPNIEITLEVNPGTAEYRNLAGYRTAGVNRLSLGIQSFDNRHLQNLGRIHDRAEAFTAIDGARRAGFDNFNLDLMHGLQDQTPEQAATDLEQAVALGPTHISWYQLTIEPNTAFYRQPPAIPKDSVLEAIQQAGQQVLRDNGYRQYEISAFARDGRESIHNRQYWEFGDYIGIGAGAHGKVTCPESGIILRTSKTRLPADYLARKDSHIATRSAIPEPELALEFLMNALRLKRGVPTQFFAERTGLDFAVITERWNHLQEMGLVESPEHDLRTTEQGYRYLDSILQAFLER